jgi:hypothetical protein
MNTLVALTSTAIDLRVPTKLSLDAPPAMLLSSCPLRRLAPVIRLTGSPHLQHPYFWNQFILLLKAAATATHSRESLLCWCSSPSLTVLFPCA